MHCRLKASNQKRMIKTGFFQLPWKDQFRFICKTASSSPTKINFISKTSFTRIKVLRKLICLPRISLQFGHQPIPTHQTCFLQDRWSQLEGNALKRKPFQPSSTYTSSQIAVIRTSDWIYGEHFLNRQQRKEIKVWHVGMLSDVIRTEKEL